MKKTKTIPVCSVCGVDDFTVSDCHFCEKANCIKHELMIDYRSICRTHIAPEILKKLEG